VLVNTAANTVRLGLTGGIGSGKSTVATILQQAGAYVVDADALSRRATATDGAAMQAIEATFGKQFIAADGSLEREAMRTLVFTDSSAKARLEAIVHPIVAAQIQALEDVAVAAGNRVLVFDLPLLVESAHWRAHLSAVIVVDCLPETQIQRVMQRNGHSRAQVEKIMAAQANRQQRLAAADTVIYNDGINLQALQHEVLQLARQWGLASGYDVA
jgi:dephospho-CoA kinase